MAGVPPKKGVAFSFTTALTDQSDTKLLKANPTLATADCQVSKDYGAFANLATLPDAEPDAGYAIRVQLSATEMDADVVTVLFHDTSGAEWCDQVITILTDTATIGEIEAQTDDIGASGAGLTAIPTIANVTTVDSTTTIGATGLAAIAAAVWDALTSALTTAGSVGAYLLSKLGLLTAATSVTVASPISGGTVTTVQGDDYKAEDGRAIEWVVSTPVDLTGGTVEVVLSGVATYTGSVVGTDTIRLELTAEETAAIHRGRYRYQVVHTQSVALGSDVTTLAEGTWISNERVTV